MQTRRLAIGPITSLEWWTVYRGPIQDQYPVFPPLLLWIVWLKSNKYQAERLTSVSHFRRTTASDNIWTAA